jgi:frataxin
MARLDEGEFERLAGETLMRLFDAVEEVADDAFGEEAEIELQQGILTIDVPGTGRWVVNRHAVTRQIWLSSPVSGAAHYNWDGHQWVGSRGEGPLCSRLEAELSALAKVPVELA